MDFAQCFRQLLSFEGDYAHMAADPGGKTRFGITEAVAREAGYRGEMQALPLVLAEQIYRERYWNALRAEELPAALRLCMFDAAVASGVKQAVVWLQRALKVSPDGVLGPLTLAAVRASEPVALKASILGERLQFLASLPHWPTFSRGWSRRIAALLQSGT